MLPTHFVMKKKKPPVLASEYMPGESPFAKSYVFLDIRHIEVNI